MVKGYIMASAQQMPENLLSYRPTEEVRTFGQILGHVANSQYEFCAPAMGEATQPPEDFELRTTRAGLVEALQIAFAYCDKAYAMDDAKALAAIKMWGQDHTPLWALDFNVAHAMEHYGNLVTYMRANGLVPPSSQRGGT